jgi:hypothetical protein
MHEQILGCLIVVFCTITGVYKRLSQFFVRLVTLEGLLWLM